MKNERFECRIPTEGKKYIKKAAKEMGLNMSEYILYLIMKDISSKEFLKENKNNSPPI